MVEEGPREGQLEDLTLKGFNHPILAVEILRWREEVDNVVDAASARGQARDGRDPSFVGWARVSVPSSQVTTRWRGMVGHAALCERGTRSTCPRIPAQRLRRCR